MKKAFNIPEEEEYEFTACYFSVFLYDNEIFTKLC
jgi:hypothetical protein